MSTFLRASTRRLLPARNDDLPGREVHPNNDPDMTTQLDIEGPSHEVGQLNIVSFWTSWRGSSSLTRIGGCLSRRRLGGQDRSPGELPRRMDQRRHH